MQDDHGNGPTAGRLSPRLVAAAATAGATLGLALAGSQSASGGAGACAAAAGHLGGCAPGAVLTAKPYVTAGLIGMLLAALIAIAAVLVCREAVAALETVRRREPLRTRPAGVVGARRPPSTGALTPRVRH